MLAVVLAVAALLRPYADNQRNWLVVGAVSAGLAAVATAAVGGVSAVGRGVRVFWRAVRAEWSAHRCR